MSRIESVEKKYEPESECKEQSPRENYFLRDNLDIFVDALPADTDVRISREKKKEIYHRPKKACYDLLLQHVDPFAFYDPF